MGLITYSFLTYTIHAVLMALMFFIILFPLLWGLQKAKPSIVRAFLVALLGAITYRAANELFYNWIYFWTTLFLNPFFLIWVFIGPPIVLFFVNLPATVKVLRTGWRKATILTLILTVLSFFIYWIANSIIYPLVPYIIFIQELTTP